MEIKKCDLVNGLGRCVVNQNLCKPDLKHCTDVVSAYFYGMKIGLAEKHHAELEAINKRCGDAVEVLKTLAAAKDEKGRKNAVLNSEKSTDAGAGKA